MGKKKKSALSNLAELVLTSTPAGGLQGGDGSVSKAPSPLHSLGSFFTNDVNPFHPHTYSPQQVQNLEHPMNGPTQAFDFMGKPRGFQSLFVHGGGAASAAPAPAQQAGGSLGALGALLGAGGAYTGQLAGGAAAPPPSPQSLIDQIMQQYGSSGPAVTPALIDVNSVTAPYDTAKADVLKQAQAGQQQLAQLLSASQAANQAQSQAEQQRLQALQANQTAAGQQAASQVADTAAQAAHALQAQGVDPTVAAGLQADSQALQGNVEQQRAAAQRFLADQQANAQLDALTRASDSQAGDFAAQKSLTSNLNSALNQLTLAQTNARTQAEQANTQAQNQANVQNAQINGTPLQNRMQLASQFSQILGSTPDAFATPQRDAVLGEITDYQTRHPGSFAGDALSTALQMSSTPQDAMSNLQTLLANARDSKGKVVHHQWDYSWFNNLINRYYTQDTSQLSPQGLQALRLHYGLFGNG